MDPGPGLPLSLPSFSVVFLLLLVAGGGLFFWRYYRAKMLPFHQAGLALVARVDLSPQHALYLVEAGGRKLLLGGAPGGLSLLTELPERTGAGERPDRIPFEAFESEKERAA